MDSSDKQDKNKLAFPQAEPVLSSDLPKARIPQRPIFLPLFSGRPPFHRVLDNYSSMRATVHTLEVGGKFGTGRGTQSYGVEKLREKETSKTPFFSVCVQTLRFLVHVGNGQRNQEEVRRKMEASLSFWQIDTDLEFGSYVREIVKVTCLH